jgi:hypothetical protein
MSRRLHPNSKTLRVPNTRTRSSSPMLICQKTFRLSNTDTTTIDTTNTIVIYPEHIQTTIIAATDVFTTDHNNILPVVVIVGSNRTWSASTTIPKPPQPH